MGTEGPNAVANGRTCVVTGSTWGIGREVARHLAECRVRVPGVGRDTGRCREAEREIRACTGNPPSCL